MVSRALPFETIFFVVLFTCPTIFIGSSFNYFVGIKVLLLEIVVHYSNIVISPFSPSRASQLCIL